jgi:hypothetical protein
MDSVKKNQGFPVRQAEFFAANACEQPALYKQGAGCIVVWNHLEYWLEGFSEWPILLYYYEQRQKEGGFCCEFFFIRLLFCSMLCRSLCLEVSFVIAPGLAMAVPILILTVKLRHV